MPLRVGAVEINDVILSVTVPFVVYWVTAFIYETLARSDAKWLNKYRIHAPKAEDKFNLVTRRQIVPMVMGQHVLQAILGLIFLDEPVDMSQRTFTGELVRFVGAMVVLDAWQFSFHRLFHEVDWLYKNIHIWHHRMFVPHAYGALYQHPIEMVIMDTLSGMVAVMATGCAPITAMFFWSISYIKVVSDHSGFKFPVNPTNLPGLNNAEYHDVHHSPIGVRHNFAQPWFTVWDRIYGCYQDPLDKAALPFKKLA